MLFNSTQELKSNGYNGFVSVNSLMNNHCSAVPNQKGIYLILRLSENPVFTENSVGGHFKSRNPAVNIFELNNNWVVDSIVIYIGQAGGGTSSAIVQKRLKQKAIRLVIGEEDIYGN